jgi:hypothetical protein
MTISGRREKSLDGREVMELWIKLDSLGRVERYYRTKGIVNPRTGQPFSTNAFWRSASIFMCEYPDDARVYYSQAGAIYTDVQWELLVLRRAMQIYKANRSTFLRWVISKEWPKKYESIYKDEFRVEPDDYNYFDQTARRMPKGIGRQSKRRDSLPE